MWTHSRYGYNQSRGHINPLILSVEGLHFDSYPCVVFCLAIGGDSCVNLGPVILRSWKSISEVIPARSRGPLLHH